MRGYNREISSSSLSSTPVNGVRFGSTAQTSIYYIVSALSVSCFAGGALTRKRPLLGVPRTTMNPTKRTVMTLLARAKNAQTLHTLRHTTRHSEMAVVASALEQ